MTVKNYIIGFVGSIILTLLAYGLTVTGGLGRGIVLLVLLGILALSQMVVQLMFFLHLPEEVKPRYKMLSFGAMASILIIVVVGSLWIMNHLNYNMMHMSPQAKDLHMTGQKDKGF
jgi:cytochrome o ubiquinol oxidase subunit IV